MEALYRPVKPELEEQLLHDLSPEVPWALVKRFSTLVRESSSDDEREAAQYIADRLRELGVPHHVYEPELFLSVPISASVEVEGQQIRAKTPSFSASTGPGGLSGEIVYVPGTSPQTMAELFNSKLGGPEDVRGKILLTEGYGFEDVVRHFEVNGAIGQIHINPGEGIHWGICSTIWGAPDLNSSSRQPRRPVVTINQLDGQALLRRVAKGDTKATIRTALKEGWFKCPLVVAEIQGDQEPERFVLVHGHYDSWGVGVGDNAVGDATLLELARVFHTRMQGLARSLKVAWWPGHSTGRYAGSTWFADHFALDLAQNCVAQVNIDSPGCRWATRYEDVFWMSEAEDLCIQAIRDATGQEASGARPLRAGDYSFNNIGISSFFMLLSTMPGELREQKGYYPVGGCGGNIEWHTEYDTLDIADLDNLMRDLRVYVVSLQRVLNNPIHPFDYRKLADEMRSTLATYARGAGGLVEFSPALAAVRTLRAELDRLYGEIPTLVDRRVHDTTVRMVNDLMLELARSLIPINYGRCGRFRNDPAVEMAPLPDLAPALKAEEVKGHDRQVLGTHLKRGINRVTWVVERSAEAVRAVNQRLVRSR